MLNLRLVLTGQNATKEGHMDKYLGFLEEIKRYPRTYQSNYARNNAMYVAEAASRGHITCLDGRARSMGAWHITASGTELLHTHGRIV